MKQAFPAEALSGSLKNYRTSKDPDIFSRADAFFEWQDLRRQHGLWPYARATSSAPQAHAQVTSDSGQTYSGINFASQDYLSLSFHPEIRAAAHEAIERYGVHSAGSAALLGNTAYSLELAADLSDFLGGREIVLYPTGWAAGYAAIQGFARSEDHVVLDLLAHSCLQSGAMAATRKVHFHRHVDIASIARKLASIRQTDSRNGIIVATEGVFSMHSTTPDMREIRALCDRFGAILLVDCAHDFGCLGEDGLGRIGEQQSLDKVDILIGSFSKSFASNGGFIAVKRRSAAEYLKYYSAPHTFSNALSPAQAAVVLRALSIIRSEEGRQLRLKLMGNILELRRAMAEAGAEVLGSPSPIVPVQVGAEALGRLVSRHLSELGVIANLVEYPAVPHGQSRFRFQVMAAHTGEDVRAVVAAFGKAMRLGNVDLEALRPAFTNPSAADA
jgi:7-keto-8-aminopelargonate synthetase-like enzyme